MSIIGIFISRFKRGKVVYFSNADFVESSVHIPSNIEKRSVSS